MLHLSTPVRILGKKATASASRTATSSNRLTLLARSFHPSAKQKMAEGDTGSARRGGVASADAFSKREEASENLYIKQQEQEKLRQLKAKLKERQESVEAQKKAIEELEGKK